MFAAALSIILSIIALVLISVILIMAGYSIIESLVKAPETPPTGATRSRSIQH